MSTDADRRGADDGESIGADRRSSAEHVGWAHPGAGRSLLGHDLRRTRLGLTSLAVTVGVLAASDVATRVASHQVAGVRLQSATPAFDTLTAIAILTSTALVLVGPFAYASWNGGPALAFAIPVVPVAFGELVAGRYVLGIDTVVALTTGAAGAALACYVAHARATGSRRPWRVGAPDVVHATFALVVATGAAVAAARFVVVAPERLVAAYVPFVAVWTVPVAVAACYATAKCRPSARNQFAD